MKILLAVDGSDYSNAAVDVVAGRPWPEGSEVKIISAAEVPYMHAPEKWVLPESSSSQLAQAVKAQAESAVREASRRLQAGRVTPLNAVVETREGHAGDVIIDEAERWGADLIVVGSHGYRAFKRFLLGSVSHAVATHAPCSVEIVRGAVAGHPCSSFRHRRSRVAAPVPWANVTRATTDSCYAGGLLPGRGH